MMVLMALVTTFLTTPLLEMVNPVRQSELVEHWTAPHVRKIALVGSTFP